MESSNPTVWAKSQAGRFFVPCQLSAHTAGSVDAKWPVFFPPFIGWTMPFYQLCGQKVELGGFLYHANFPPTQLDQLTPSGPFFFPLLVGLCHSILFFFYGVG
jgi:hypothetical protein